MSKKYARFSKRKNKPVDKNISENIEAKYINLSTEKCVVCCCSFVTARNEKHATIDKEKKKKKPLSICIRKQVRI